MGVPQTVSAGWQLNSRAAEHDGSSSSSPSCSNVLGYWRRKEKIETWSDRNRRIGCAERIEIKGEERKEEEGEPVAIGVRDERNEWWQGMSGVRGFQQDSCLIRKLFVFHDHLGPSFHLTCLPLGSKYLGFCCCFLQADT
jgi:hypothetical protein